MTNPKSMILRGCVFLNDYYSLFAISKTLNSDMKKIIAEIKTTPDYVEKLTYIVRMFPKKNQVC